MYFISVSNKIVTQHLNEMELDFTKLLDEYLLGDAPNQSLTVLKIYSNLIADCDDDDMAVMAKDGLVSKLNKVWFKRGLSSPEIAKTYFYCIGNIACT